MALSEVEWIGVERREVSFQSEFNWNRHTNTKPYNRIKIVLLGRLVGAGFSLSLSHHIHWIKWAIGWWAHIYVLIFVYILHDNFMLFSYDQLITYSFHANKCIIKCYRSQMVGCDKEKNPYNIRINGPFLSSYRTQHTSVQHVEKKNCVGCRFDAAIVSLLPPINGRDFFLLALHHE